MNGGRKIVVRRQRGEGTWECCLACNAAVVGCTVDDLGRRVIFAAAKRLKFDGMSHAGTLTLVDNVVGGARRIKGCCWDSCGRRTGDRRRSMTSRHRFRNGDGGRCAAAY